MRLGRSPQYSPWFKRIYKRPPDKASLLDALVTFQKSLITPNARFDQYLSGDKGALTPAELEGLNIFMGYGCASCHQGVNLGGNMLQKFGVFRAASRVGTGSRPRRAAVASWTRARRGPVPGSQPEECRRHRAVLS